VRSSEAWATSTSVGLGVIPWTSFAPPKHWAHPFGCERCWLGTATAQHSTQGAVVVAPSPAFSLGAAHNQATPNRQRRSRIMGGGEGCGKAAAPQSQTVETRALKKQASPSPARPASQPANPPCRLDGAGSHDRASSLQQNQQHQQQRPPSPVGRLSSVEPGDGGAVAGPLPCRARRTDPADSSLPPPGLGGASKTGNMGGAARDPIPGGDAVVPRGRF